MSPKNQNQRHSRAEPASPAAPPSERDTLLASIDDVVHQHDEKIRLLFQLSSFVSLVRYNPVEARKDKSAHFEGFRLQYDLWEAQANAAESRGARRRVQQIHDVYDAYVEHKAEKSAEVAVAKEPRATKQPKPTKQPAKPVQKRAKPPAPPSPVAARGRTRRQVVESRPPSPEPAPRKTTAKKRARNGKEAPKSRELQVDRELELVEESADEEGMPPVKRFRLRLHKRIQPTISVSHPFHVATPAFGGDLDQLLDSYHLVDDEVPTTTYEEYVDRQVAAVNRINAARESGLLQELEEIGVGGVARSLRPFADPTFGSEPSFADKLVSRITYLARLRNNLRRNHLGIAKRAAQAVEQYFRRLEGADEKERKDQERLIRQLARRIGQMVMKKWKLAEKVVEQRRKAVLAEEHREKGKEYLNQILEQSSKLIESHAANLDGAEIDIESESDGHSASAHSDVDSDSDSELTVDQLREKYSAMSTMSPVVEVDAEAEAGGDADKTDGELQLEKPSEELLRLYENEKVEFSEKESESESESESEIDSESEAESASEAESEPTSEAADGPEQESERQERKGTLATLFGAPNGHSLSESDSDFAMEPEDSEPVVESASEVEDDDSSAGKKLEAIPEAGTAADETEIKEEVNGIAPDEIKHDEEHEQELVDEAEAPQNHVDVPFLLRGTLREYQRKGLDWLAGLYSSQTNGILADEMGLGKTIQTIALLAWLACEKHIWGPHLIVVPTSVMLNWEMEFKKFCPGFKVLTYFGNPQQRKRKRKGWNKEDTWHVCITSYQLVIQDQAAFRGKRWQYMILDEAHNIKNFRSQRWQALLNFNTQNRLLLTGTPLQNNLMELWSLLYFLMPSSRGSRMMPTGFASLEDFQDWFARPVDQMVEEGDEADDEARATIAKLHRVLRPYLLRRLKKDVEKQMPGKYEHIVYCKLSKRQRYLYDDFMSRGSTRATLASGNYMSILNCLMQLRKVCNHPDLFEVRPIVTSFEVDRSVPALFEPLASKFACEPAINLADLDEFNLLFSHMETEPKWRALSVHQLNDNAGIAEALSENLLETVFAEPDTTSVESWARYALYKRRIVRAEQRERALRLNKLRTSRIPIYGSEFRKLMHITRPEPTIATETQELLRVRAPVLSVAAREAAMFEIVTRFEFVTPAIVCLDQPELTLGGGVTEAEDFKVVAQNPAFHESQVRLSIAFPDKRLLQYDCGKLQKMAILMRDLIAKGHRALIFTQMTRVLDILEQFLNLHGWRYLRLDGATRIEQRQALTERFNKDPSIPVFILSTRSGGLGINLTGADTVIFYDSDWNPAMDRQCQDRCHRIGQTRDVHIYRLVSEYTIESNILRKATQKTILDNVVIQEGDFTTEYLSRMSVKDILGDNAGRDSSQESFQLLGNNFEAALAQAEDADDRAAAKIATNEANMDREEFSETAKLQTATPGPTSREASAEPESGDVDLEAEPTQTPTPTATRDGSEMPEDADGADGPDESAPGHIDDFMIRAIERGLYS